MFGAKLFPIKDNSDVYPSTCGTALTRVRMKGSALCAVSICMKLVGLPYTSHIMHVDMWKRGLSVDAFLQLNIIAYDTQLTH